MLKAQWKAQVLVNLASSHMLQTDPSVVVVRVVYRNGHARPRPWSLLTPPLGSAPPIPILFLNSDNK